MTYFFMIIKNRKLIIKFTVNIFYKYLLNYRITYHLLSISKLIKEYITNCMQKQIICNTTIEVLFSSHKNEIFPYLVAAPAQLDF